MTQSLTIKLLTACTKIMILNPIYLGISLFFIYGTYESLPRNGCFPVTGAGSGSQSIICSDFQSFQLITILWFVLALLFALLALFRAFKKATLQTLNSYNSKDLHSQRFLNTQLTNTIQNGRKLFGYPLRDFSQRVFDVQLKKLYT